MIRELDCVTLTHDIPDAGLRKGDLGAVVCVHEGGQAFEVEFIDSMGMTVALLTLKPDDVRLYEGGPFTRPTASDKDWTDASASSQDFWDNSADDRDWNGA